MGWTSYWVGPDCNRKEECMRYVRGFKDTNGKETAKLLKSVMKGTHFYALMETTDEKHEQFIFVLLTEIDKGEFYYKDIQCNPYEVGGIPNSLLKMFKPSNDKDKEWLAKNLAANKEVAEKNKVSLKLKVGDILEVTNGAYPLSWNGGFSIAPNEKFFIRVDEKQGWKRNTKQYVLVRKVDKVAEVLRISDDYTESELLEKFHGNRYDYRSEWKAIKGKTLNGLQFTKVN